ncbi:MAG: hypothetical protein ACK4ND_04310 [Cytophagaceae bacterium]
MIIKTFLAFFIIFLFLSVEIQSQNINWGENLKYGPRENIINFIGEDETGFYVLIKKTTDFTLRPSYWLERYNSNMELVFSKELEIPVKKDENLQAFFSSLYYVEGKLMLFYSVFNRATRERFAYCNFVQNDGSIEKKTFELGIIESPSSTFLNDDAFKIYLSDDNTKIIVTKVRPFAEKNERLAFTVWDLDFNMLWHQSMSLPEKGEYVSLSDYIFDKEGNMHMLIKVENTRTDRRKGLPRFYFNIFSYYWKMDAFIEYELGNDKLNILEAGLQMDHNDNLIVTGFFSDNDKGGFKGLAFTRINPATTKIEVKKFNEFDENYINLFERKKSIRKGIELKNFYFDHIRLMEDGGVVIFSERKYDENHDIMGTPHVPNISRPFSRWQTISEASMYYHNEILVSRIDSEGNVVWWTQIPKVQKNKPYDSEFASYALRQENEKFMIIFNDHPKNLDIAHLSKVKVMKKPESATTFMVTVEGDGSLTKTLLFQAKSNKAIFYPRIYLQNRNKELIVYAEKQRLYRFGILGF